MYSSDGTLRVRSFFFRSVPTFLFILLHSNGPRFTSHQPKKHHRIQTHTSHRTIFFLVFFARDAEKNGAKKTSQRQKCCCEHGKSRALLSLILTNTEKRETLTRSARSLLLLAARKFIYIYSCLLKVRFGASTFLRSVFGVQKSMERGEKKRIKIPNELQKYVYDVFRREWGDKQLSE